MGKPQGQLSARDPDRLSPHFLTGPRRLPRGRRQPWGTRRPGCQGRCSSPCGGGQSRPGSLPSRWPPPCCRAGPLGEVLRPRSTAERAYPCRQGRQSGAGSLGVSCLGTVGADTEGAMGCPLRSSPTVSNSELCVTAHAAARCLNGHSNKPTLLPGLQGALVEGSWVPVGLSLIHISEPTRPKR